MPKLESDILFAVEAHQFMRMEGQLPIWTVTQNPTEMPGKCIARLHKVSGDGHAPTNTFIMRDTVEALRRDLMRRLGLAVITRDTTDDPVIVESWV